MSKKGRELIAKVSRFLTEQRKYQEKHPRDLWDISGEFPEQDPRNILYAERTASELVSLANYK